VGDQHLNSSNDTIDIIKKTDGIVVVLYVLVPAEFATVGTVISGGSPVFACEEILPDGTGEWSKTLVLADEERSSQISPCGIFGVYSKDAANHEYCCENKFHVSK